jgi:hypothetical protein
MASITMNFVKRMVEENIKKIENADNLRDVDFNYGSGSGALLLAIFAEDTDWDLENDLRRRLAEAFSASSGRLYKEDREREDGLVVDTVEWMSKATSVGN